MGEVGSGVGAALRVATYAALDLGTNNCRLLVARAGAAPPAEGAAPMPAAATADGAGNGPGPGFHVIDAFSRIVRLGEGVAQSGRLSEAAMARTVEALKVCAGKIERRGVTALRAVATEACRRAANCREFVARVLEETGIALDIISTAEEAALAFTGCLPLLEPPARGKEGFALLFDIGGGSTELGWLALGPGRAPRILAWHSMKLGVVSLTEEFGTEARDGEAADAFYEGLVARAGEALEPFARAIGAGRAIAAGNVQMLGTSGTVTTLAGIRQQLPRYERALVDGAWLGFADATRISGELARLDCRGRAAIPCIGAERADLVLSGCAILAAICRRWPVGRLRVADRGVREGILTTLMQEAAAGAPPAPLFA